MTSVVVVTVALLIAPPVVSGRAGPCDQFATSAPLRIERDRIGPYPAAGTLDELRTLCPTAEGTLGSGFESVWAALDLSVGELTILAGQNWLSKALFDDPGPEPRPDWDQAPSHWVVRGCGGQLPRAVSSCGTWSDLVTAFGLEGEWYAEFGPVLVRLEALPGFQIRLSVTDEVVGGIGVDQDLSRIPLDARIEEIVIVPGVQANEELLRSWSGLPGSRRSPKTQHRPMAHSWPSSCRG
jgi:hypothetical protein